MSRTVDILRNTSERLWSHAHSYITEAISVRLTLTEEAATLLNLRRALPIKRYQLPPRPITIGNAQLAANFQPSKKLYVSQLRR